VTIKAVFYNSTDKRSVAAGDVVFAEGDAGHEMYGVVSGSIELRHGDKVVGRAGPGETFGELAIIDAAPRALTAVAIEPSEIVAINERMFLFLVHETPTFALQVMRSLSHMIRDLDELTSTD
jgi:CRP/FNR family transcriptional regulator, cyclic AMP receptor protein